LMSRRPEGRALTEDLAGALRRDAGLRRVFDRVWPAVTAEALVRKLVTSKATLAKAADGVLTPAEQRLLLRKAAKKADDEAWTVADAALVDEADALLGGRPRRYGHVVVDEAQDLSAMAWRMVGRRCAHGVSMTVLGDLAQSTAPAGQSDWVEVWRLLGAPDAVEHRELSMGYRVPGQILDYANRLLPATGASVRPSASVRATPAEPEIHQAVEGDLSSMVASVVERLAARWASVAVIVPDGLDGLDGAVAETAVVTVLSPAEAKGLEFDAVVVVEPAALFDQGERGARLLYVAMTRAVQHLAVVHVAPLPAPLAGARQDGGR
jgi:DNA helicase IV